MIGDDGAIVLAVELDVGQQKRRLDRTVIDSHVRAPGGAVGSAEVGLAHHGPQGWRATQTAGAVSELHQMR